MSRMSDFRLPDSRHNIAIYIGEVAKQMGHNQAWQHDKNPMGLFNLIVVIISNMTASNKSSASK